MADFWDGIAQFFGYNRWEWGSAGEWLAVLGALGAAYVTWRIYERGRYFEDRKQADELHTTLSVKQSIGASGGDLKEFEFRAENTSGAPIWIPIAYVPTMDGNGYDQVRLYTEEKVGVLESGAGTRRYLPHSDPGVSRAGVIVRFRDARNRWWTRYLETGRYIAERKFKKLQKQRPGGSQLAISQLEKSLFMGSK